MFNCALPKVATVAGRIDWWGIVDAVNIFIITSSIPKRVN